jgi:hypothetical protein
VVVERTLEKLKGVDKQSTLWYNKFIKRKKWGK